MVPLANHVLMFRSMTGHVSSEITAFAVEELTADVTVCPVLAGVRGEVFGQDLLVHESLRASGKATFEGTRV